MQQQLQTCCWLSSTCNEKLTVACAAVLLPFTHQRCILFSSCSRLFENTVIKLLIINDFYYWHEACTPFDTD